MMTAEEFARNRRGMEGPAWRAKAALAGIGLDTRLTKLYDEPLLNFIKYLQLKDDTAEADRASATYPSIAAAEQLNADPEKTATLKLMVMAEMEQGEMHCLSGIDLAVLQAWETLFFDARGQQQATTWIALQVMGQEHRSGDPRFESKLKLAIMAGPVAVRAMLDMDKGVQLDEADRLFQRRLKLHEKIDTAVGMPIESETNRLRYLKSTAELMLAEQRLTLAEKKLAQRCTETHQLYKLRKYRQTQSAQRATLKLKAALHNQETHKERQEMKRKSRKLDPMQQLGMQLAAKHRAAISPLAKLTWTAKAPVNPPTEVPVADIASTTNVTKETVESETELHQNDTINKTIEAEIVPPYESPVASV